MYIFFKSIVVCKVRFGFFSNVGGCNSTLGRASVKLSEGCWFKSPDLHVEVSLGKIVNPKLVSSSHGSHRHQCMNVCMNYWKSLWTKASARCECKRLTCAISPEESQVKSKSALTLKENTIRFLVWNEMRRLRPLSVCATVMAKHLFYSFQAYNLLHLRNLGQIDTTTQ